MNYAQKILSELDSHLTSAVELSLYGRAAFLLGFEDPAPEFSQSLDVDGVLWMGQAEYLFEETNFWSALETTNENLESENLYMSHLFEENQVILSKDWKKNRVSIAGAWKHLTLLRLSDEDLLLSKLMRDDPQDRHDARFIISRNNWTVDHLMTLFSKARIPDLQELHDEFGKASAKLLKSLGEH